MSTSATYLGLTLDNKLNFAAHVRNTKVKAMKCYRALYPMLSAKSKLSRKNRLLLYTSIIRPIITYGAPIWQAASNTSIKSLQTTQNKCLKTIFGFNNRFPTDTLHDIAELPPLDEHTQAITANTFAKCTNSNFEILRALVPD